MRPVADRTKANAKAAEAQRALAIERDVGIARLEASRLVGDRLFVWAMEKGNRRLPPLDGRELRLQRLERYFEDFLTRTGEVGTLADERARVQLQLTEIAISTGDAAIGRASGSATRSRRGRNCLWMPR